MTTCSEALSLAEAARNQVLDADTQTRLQGHLASCVSCRACVAQDDMHDQAIVAALNRTADAAADDALFGRALAAVLPESSPRTDHPSPWWQQLPQRPSGSLMRWLALAASLALLAFFSMAGLGLRHAHQTTPQAEDPPQSSPSAR